MPHPHTQQDAASALPSLAPSPALLQRLLAHIEAQHLDPALTPQTAARDLGVSLRQLHAVLAGTRHSFSQRVTQRRLHRAQSLLATDRANVADVAFACGFSSLATFYRQYTVAFGVTPAARRQRPGVSTSRWKEAAPDLATCTR